MISLVVGILTAILVGAILFWATDNYCPNRRLAQLLKLLGSTGLSGVDREPPASDARVPVFSVAEEKARLDSTAPSNDE